VLLIPVLVSPLPFVIYDLSHERWGATNEPSKNGQLCYPDSIDWLLREAAQNKVLNDQNAYANDHSITFMPAIASNTGQGFLSTLII